MGATRYPELFTTLDKKPPSDDPRELLTQCKRILGERLSYFILPLKRQKCDEEFIAVKREYGIGEELTPNLSPHLGSLIFRTCRGKVRVFRLTNDPFFRTDREILEAFGGGHIRVMKRPINPTRKGNRLSWTSYILVREIENLRRLYGSLPPKAAG